MLPKLFHIVSYRTNDSSTPITLDGNQGGGHEDKPPPSDIGS